MADPNDYYPVAVATIESSGWPDVAVAPDDDLFMQFSGCFEGMGDDCISFVCVRKTEDVTGTILENITPFTSLLDIPQRI